MAVNLISTNEKITTIHKEYCKACELCIHHCPQKILYLDSSINTLGHHPVAVKNPDKCTACGNCALMCPDMAITLEEVNSNDRKIDEG
ncbi:4Fe-4S binding protein [Metallumcola ferriviriculae]|uniref:4Fe-4S binding protein n=1 Tax=Metallumcola ferriviriculae TaxID=3039180 RepID=A0AAU0UN95_9FIRM|nr:4Fe-4S binding protein [Desulfitibacteraceae bacterium MK1]